ncbi:MAG TPA: energy-coupling factor transporter transmembrane component T [Candidatus Limnocylindrales bacterium]|nr:energy-coupling factor transporter transmembrane component T [Candidatus Limnocylindrales bacterium]
MTLQPTTLDAAQRRSLLGRVSPLVKLGVAAAWLLGLATTVDPRPGLLLAAAALAAIPTLGAVPRDRVVRRLWPLLLAGLGIALTNLLFSASNADPSATELLRLGPLRLTAEGAATALGLGSRVLAIVAVGAAFALTTEATGLADALVQQAGLSPRFAYGALAAYQAVPRLADDLGTLRAARRLRGLREWHPRILVGLLVRAIRHADQLALAMDARAFGTGPRTTYRPMRWGIADVVVGVAGLGLLVVALVALR